MHEQAVSLYLPLVLTRQQLVSVDMPLKEDKTNYVLEPPTSW
jgi:hypothetical protein